MLQVDTDHHDDPCFFKKIPALFLTVLFSILIFCNNLGVSLDFIHAHPISETIEMVPECSNENEAGASSFMAYVATPSSEMGGVAWQLAWLIHEGTQTVSAHETDGQGQRAPPMSA
jgi:hypothetical protein